MKIKVKTQKQLLDEGFRSNKNGYFLGESKSNPALQVSWYQWQHVTGREFEIWKRETRRGGEPTFLTTENLTIPWFLIDGQLPDKSKLTDLSKEKDFGEGTVTICCATGRIEFSCSLSKMTWKEVKAIYAWLSKHFEKGKK